MPRTGSESTRLVILRGNSASGKSTVAAEIRERYGRAEMSDWYREHDVLPGGIEQVILADSPLHATVEHVMNDIGLAQEDGKAAACLTQT